MYYVRYTNDHFSNLFIVLWHLLVLMVAALNLNTLDHILHKLVSKKKKAFGEIFYAVTQQVQMNLIFTDKCYGYPAMSKSPKQLLYVFMKRIGQF